MTDAPPLTGLKVLEFAGLAPGPFAGVFFADAGAQVLRIDRPVPGLSHAASPAAPPPPPTDDLLTRHKASIAVDLKNPAGVALVRQLAAAGNADILIDPFRPGVLERLGLGPDVLLAANPGLIYARLSGFRRDGKYHAMAGHDINYLAVSGMLSMLGRAGDKPTPPWNVLADFAGGGLMLVVGVLAALLARQRSGRGQVVEASMVDGVSYLSTFPRFATKTPLGNQPRGQNNLDTGCPYYDTYETADGGFMAVGAIEPQFFAILVDKLGLADQDWPARRAHRAEWPALRAALANAFRTRPRAHWERVFDGSDACCTPVLDFAEMERGAASGAREGDLRPAVALRATPLRAVTQLAPAADPVVQNRRGQGPGVAGQGYDGSPLYPGQGGEAVLAQWHGWQKGAQYDVKNGGLVLKEGEKSRL